MSSPTKNSRPRLPRSMSASKDQSSGSDRMKQHVPANKAAISRDHASGSDMLHAAILRDHSSGADRIVPASGYKAAISKDHSAVSDRIAHVSGNKAAISKDYSSVPDTIVHASGNKAIEMERTKRVCTMCGDIGLREKLFRCIKCRFRFQHTYCSNWYPKKRSYAGICNWCDTEDEHRRKQTKQTQTCSAVDSCMANQRNICDRIEDNCKINEGKVCNKILQGDTAKPRLWRNELEMLLEAAVVAGVGSPKQAGVGSKKESEDLYSNSQCEDASSSDWERPRMLPQTDQRNNPKGQDTILKCKDEPSTLSKKIGRRYKLVLDVY